MPLRCAASRASRIWPAYSTAFPIGHRAFQRSALDVFHHQVIGADIVKLADVGMVQRSHGPGFLFEALGELLLRNLDGDRAVEPRVPGLPHFSHPARAQRREDFIRT